MKTTTDIVNAVLDDFIDGSEERTSPLLARAVQNDDEYYKLRELLGQAVFQARTSITVIRGWETPLTEVLKLDAAMAKARADEIRSTPADQLDRNAIASNFADLGESLRILAAALEETVPTA